VRGLTEVLKISKPAITRALDRLSDIELVRRKPDEQDRRSVLIQPTVRGSVFLREFAELISEAAGQLGLLFFLSFAKMASGRGPVLAQVCGQHGFRRCRLYPQVIKSEQVTGNHIV
jgi:DNA-binding MarR family transcriptional regulator